MIFSTLVSSFLCFEQERCISIRALDRFSSRTANRQVSRSVSIKTNFQKSGLENSYISETPEVAYIPALWLSILAPVKVCPKTADLLTSPKSFSEFLLVVQNLEKNDNILKNKCPYIFWLILKFLLFSLEKLGICLLLFLVSITLDWISPKFGICLTDDRTEFGLD